LVGAAGANPPPLAAAAPPPAADPALKGFGNVVDGGAATAFVAACVALAGCDSHASVNKMWNPPHDIAQQPTKTSYHGLPSTDVPTLRRRDGRTGTFGRRPMSRRGQMTGARGTRGKAGQRT
jgi:hypothetical protein